MKKAICDIAGSLLKVFNDFFLEQFSAKFDKLFENRLHLLTRDNSCYKLLHAIDLTQFCLLCIVIYSRLYIHQWGGLVTEDVKKNISNYWEIKLLKILRSKLIKS